MRLWSWRENIRHRWKIRKNEIKALTDKIRLLSMVEQISYLMLSFGIMFACTLLFVTGIIAVGVLAANVYAK